MNDDLLETRVCTIHGLVTVSKHQRCPQCLQAEWEQFDLEKAIGGVQERLHSTRVPERYRDKTLEDFEVNTPAQKLVLDAARAYIWNFPDNFSRGRSLTFVGGVGTGKTLQYLKRGEGRK